MAPTYNFFIFMHIYVYIDIWDRSYINYNYKGALYHEKTIPIDTQTRDEYR